MSFQIKGLSRGFKKFRLASVQLFRAKKTSAFFVYGSIFLNLISWGLMIWFVQTEQSFVILHYNSFLGIDAAVNFDVEKNFFQIFIAPIGATFILILNIAIAYILALQSDLINSMDEKAVIVKKKKQKDKIREEAGKEDINYFGILLILGVSLLLQFVILLYTIAIIWVNR